MKQYSQELSMEARGYVTIQAAARRIGRKESTVYRWLKKGEVEGTKVGPKHYILVPSLLTYLGEEGARMYEEAREAEILETAGQAVLEERAE